MAVKALPPLGQRQLIEPTMRSFKPVVSLEEHTSRCLRPWKNLQAARASFWSQVQNGVALRTD
eukprot:2527419-Amphidinium_carterae.1